MNRRAILISASGVEGDKEFLKGTKKDVYNLRKFLESDIGGAWQSHEIETFNNPDANKIKALKNIDCDFTITMVSGHGGICKKDSNLYLEINGIDYKQIDFINQSKRQLMILDCCRSYFEAGELALEALQAFSSKIASDSIFFREAYNSYIKQCDEGIIFLYSSSPGEASEEDPETGAYFINSLTEAGNQWAENNNGILDVYDGINMAKNIIKKYPTIQTPEISLSKRRKWFPLCVNPR